MWGTTQGLLPICHISSYQTLLVRLVQNLSLCICPASQCWKSMHFSRENSSSVFLIFLYTVRIMCPSTFHNDQDKDDNIYLLIFEIQNRENCLKSGILFKVLYSGFVSPDDDLFTLLPEVLELRKRKV